MFEALNAEPWNIDDNRVKYHLEAGRSAASIVRSLGITPETLTMQAMEELDPWVECRSCSHKDRGDPVFRWKHAVCFQYVLCHG